MTALTTVALAAGVFAGALTQRVTGVGFALVATPPLVLVAGPFQGVVLANLLSLLISLALLAMSWRDVDWRTGARLALPSVVGVVPGAAAARILPPALLQVAVGLLITAGLLATIITARGRSRDQPHTPNIAAAPSAGVCSGFMNATAGVGGLVLTVYALRTNWEQRKFAATTQVCFVVMCATSLAVKGMPSLPAAEVSAIASAVLAGLAAGQLARRFVPTAAARRAVVLLALLGAAVTTAKGAMTW